MEKRAFEGSFGTVFGACWDKSKDKTPCKIQCVCNCLVLNERLVQCCQNGANTFVFERAFAGVVNTVFLAAMCRKPRKYRVLRVVGSKVSVLTVFCSSSVQNCVNSMVWRSFGTPGT